MLGFRNTSINTKLNLLVLVTGGVAALLLSGAFIVENVLLIRSSKAAHLATLARVVGSNSTAALTFDDAAAAGDLLASLSLQPTVRYACLFNAKGQVFAEYRADPAVALRPALGPDGSEFRSDGYLAVTQRIEHDGETVGTVYITATMDDLNRQLILAGTTVAASMVVALGIAFALSHRLQRSVSGPIVRLAKMAQRISAEGNYSLRVEKDADDELGVLYDEFNAMLAQIQRGAKELYEAHSQLEHRVAERTRQLSEAYEELANSNATLKKLNQLAETATRAKSEFLANMSHEIRTPITAILGYADIAIEESVGLPIREHIETIKRNGEHLLGLINDILDLSKVEAGQMQIEAVRCSPIQLAVEVASLMRVRADAKRLALRVDLISPLPETALTDPLRLRQVLVNLVGNAIKFTDMGEICLAVRLVSEAGRPMLRFDVSDTGIGMNEQQMAKLFQAFSQVDTSSARKFGGTGLGLCISKHLAEALGGRIEVRSEPGKGSVFSLTIDPGSLEGIPMIEHTREALLAPAPQAPRLTREGPALSGRILLAEDGPDNQRLISFFLKKAGAEVTVTENGSMACERALAASARGEPFGVILMDMQMPVMDGYTATRRLRDVGYTGPIIALTAHAMADDCQKCLAAGCDDYTTKPIHREKLLAMVAKWLGGGQPSETPAAEAECPLAPSGLVYSSLASDPDLEELVELFVQEMPGRMGALESLAKSRDWAELTRAAHQLKGAAGSYGFDAITQNAARLEAAARDAAPEDEILAALDGLLGLCRRVHAGLPQADGNPAAKTV